MDKSFFKKAKKKLLDQSEKISSGGHTITGRTRIMGCISISMGGMGFLSGICIIDMNRVVKLNINKIRWEGMKLEY